MGRLNIGGAYLDLKVEGLDTALQKMNEYQEKLKEAQSIAKELASIDLSLNFSKDEKQEGGEDSICEQSHQ